LLVSPLRLGRWIAGQARNDGRICQPSHPPSCRTRSGIQLLVSPLRPKDGLRVKPAMTALLHKGATFYANC
ncbi:MAG: hypothetical protein Q9M13_09355, partial [Mariprofundales bacterium]|nr:hypothetical protein [Mariprofundales bacterium]